MALAYTSVVVLLLPLQVIAEKSAARQTLQMQNSMQKVLSMLKTMQEELEREVAMESELFDAAMCACKNGKDELATLIANSLATVETSQSQIGEKTAEKQKLTEDLFQHKQDMVNAKNDLATATQLREKEKKRSVQSEQMDMVSIKQLDKAISVLEQGGSGSAMMQMMAPSDSSRLRKVVEAAQLLSANKRASVLAFLEQGNGDRVTDMVAAPEAAEVSGIFKSLRDDMSRDLDALLSSEHVAAQNFLALKEEKKKIIHLAKASTVAKDQRVGELVVSLANLKHALEDSQEELANSQSFLADLNETCTKKTNDRDTRKQMRAQEIITIGEVIKILSDNDANAKTSKTTRSGFLQKQTVRTYESDFRPTAAFLQLRSAHQTVRNAVTSRDKPHTSTVPLSIGIKVDGGIMDNIVDRNSAFPLEGREGFTTRRDGQSVVEFAVFEGERSMAKDNRLLGAVKLEGIPPARKGEPQFEVLFSIDATGLLSVTAVDKTTGKTADGEVKFSTAVTDLSEAAIQEMIQDAQLHAKADQEQKEAVMARIDLRDELAVAKATKNKETYANAVFEALKRFPEIEQSLNDEALQRLWEADPARAAEVIHALAAKDDEPNPSAFVISSLNKHSDPVADFLEEHPDIAQALTDDLNHELRNADPQCAIYILEVVAGKDDIANLSAAIASELARTPCAKANAGKPITIVITLEGIELSKLDSHGKEELSQTCAQTIAEHVGLDTSAVKIKLSKGSVKVVAEIFAPPGMELSDLGSSDLGSAVMAAAAKLPSVQNAATGPLAVSPPAVSSPLSTTTSTPSSELPTEGLKVRAVRVEDITEFEEASFAAKKWLDANPQSTAAEIKAKLNDLEEVAERVIPTQSRFLAEKSNAIATIVNRLIFTLHDEDVIDEIKAQDCEAAISESQAIVSTKKDELQKLDAAIAVAEDDTAGLKEDITTLDQMISDMDRKVTQATAQRKKEHQEFVDMYSTMSASKKLIEKAMTILEQFYSPKAHSHKSSGLSLAHFERRVHNHHQQNLRRHLKSTALLDTPETYVKKESGGVIGLLQTLKSELLKDMLEAEVEERHAAHEYQRTMSEDFANVRATATKSRTQKQFAKAKLDDQLVENQSQRVFTKTELNEQELYLAQRRAQCGPVMKHFDERHEGRVQDELHLGSAESIINVREQYTEERTREDVKRNFPMQAVHQ